MFSEDNPVAEEAAALFSALNDDEAGAADGSGAAASNSKTIPPLAAGGGSETAKLMSKMKGAMKSGKSEVDGESKDPGQADLVKELKKRAGDSKEAKGDM